MARETDCLFVYGTLMPGSGHPMAARLGSESRTVGPGSAPGRLYDFGAWPGAVEAAAPREQVHGMLVRLHDAANALRWLDAYEGVGEDAPEPVGFARVIVAVRTASGRHVDAWMYYYRGPLGGARHLRSGRYGVRKALASQRS